MQSNKGNIVQATYRLVLGGHMTSIVGCVAHEPQNDFPQSTGSLRNKSKNFAFPKNKRLLGRTQFTTVMVKAYKADVCVSALDC